MRDSRWDSQWDCGWDSSQVGNSRWEFPVGFPSPAFLPFQEFGVWAAPLPPRLSPVIPAGNVGPGSGWTRGGSGGLCPDPKSRIRKDPELSREGKSWNFPSPAPGPGRGDTRSVPGTPRDPPVSPIFHPLIFSIKKPQNSHFKPLGGEWGHREGTGRGPRPFPSPFFGGQDQNLG